MKNTPWSMTIEDVLSHLDADQEKGLRSAEVKKRRKRYGPNRLKEAKARSAWLILVDQFRSLIILLLALAATLSFSFGEWMQGAAVTAAIAINGCIGFFTELNAVRSMEALRKMTRAAAMVRREGRIRETPEQTLVPGDIVLVEAGDIITADLRLLEANKMRVDESALTGESVPVSKHTDPVQEEAPLAERMNMLYKGTSLTGGSGQGIVVSTGMDTELGKISALAGEATAEETPIEKRLSRLGYRLIWVTLAVSGLVLISGLIVGKELFLLLETCVALAVAAIPEGLPVVATIALARGVRRMARLNAVVNRLSAVETLGAINTIFTDTTGTLTENRMTVKRIAAPSEKGIRQIRVGNGSGRDRGSFTDKEDVDLSRHEVLREILETAVLCNNASLDGQAPEEAGKAVGDPLETALLAAGLKAGLKRDSLLAKLPEQREEAFDPETKMMATFHRENGRYRVAVKGSPEAVLDACTSVRSEKGSLKMDDEARKAWQEQNDRLAEEGHWSGIFCVNREGGRRWKKELKDSENWRS